ncbi:MAG: hypothetical protein PHX41_11760, partial [Kiritimatiellae bacterium]|nr:hypothetical protein [Kiritimatiellia bacterium]MDX9794827.1 hypothetical protein [Kiritimatiellia bacterium]
SSKPMGQHRGRNRVNPTENPRLCRSFSISGGSAMGQQGRKTQQKRETAGPAGKTSNPKPQNRHRKPKQIRMGKG